MDEIVETIDGISFRLGPDCALWIDQQTLSPLQTSALWLFIERADVDGRLEERLITIEKLKVE